MRSPIRVIMDAFKLRFGDRNPSFEAAGHGRRLMGFNPSRNHVNAAIAAAGPTLLARARWLYENDGYAGNAIDEWASAAVGDGIKPRPRLRKGGPLKPARIKKAKAALTELFWRWTEESDADGLSDYYGQQERVARETYMAGEMFLRIRSRRPGDMQTVPFQLQLLPSEMLDLSYHVTLPGGNFIRCGIEFDAIGRRVAYHFWRWHPYDDRPAMASNLRERVRVPATEVIHVYDARQAGQIRGVPKVARVLVKIFGLEVYDDAEIDRKKTAAMFTGFLIGRGENVIVNEDEEEDDDGHPIPGMQPGAMIDLPDDKDIKFSNPAEVGGSYEPFQYRNVLKISAGLGVPYAYVSGDVTRGNFSNVRTDIVRFRRRVSQWTNNTLNFQMNRVVWKTFVERAYLAGLVDLPGYDEDPGYYHSADHLLPRQDWVDPVKDVQAEKEAIKAGLKSRTQAAAERGYDREQLDDEIEEERKDAKRRGLKFDTDAETSNDTPKSSVLSLLSKGDRDEVNEDA